MTERDYLIRRSYVDFLRSKNFDPFFDRLSRPPRWRYIIAIPLALTGAGLPLAIGLVLGAWSDGRKRKRVREALIEAAERSVPIIVFPLMANRALFRELGTIAPALVIGTFDPDATTREMVDIVGKMLEISLQDGGQGAELAVQQMFLDEDYQPGRRRVIPAELTGGRRVYAFDLMMIGDFLITELQEQPLIPCIAEPGESGTIQMIPGWVASTATEPVLNPWV